jgi:hypothetical protein
VKPLLSGGAIRSTLLGILIMCLHRQCRMESQWISKPLCDLVDKRVSISSNGRCWREADIHCCFHNAKAEGLPVEVNWAFGPPNT